MHNAITVAGIDVGKDHLDVVRQAETALHRRFNNTAAGHRVLRYIQMLWPGTKKAYPDC